MVSRRVCLPAGDIGGFLSVPDCVRSPVVKNRTLWKELNSGESKILPSFEHCVWKPCFFPSSVTVVSTMLSLPSVRFTTWCSKPEDLVKTSSDLEEGEASGFGRVIAAPASAAVFRKSRRFPGLFTVISSNVIGQACPFGCEQLGNVEKTRSGVQPSSRMP